MWTMRMSRNSRWARALIAVLPLLSACYTYRVVPLDEVPVGSSVRARISAGEAEKLEALIGRDDRVLEGDVIEKPNGSLLLAVSGVVGMESGTVQRAHQRVEVPRSGLLEVELRKLDRWKTAGITAVAAGALTYVAIAQFNAQKEPKGGPGKGNPEDQVVPYAARARVPIFSIPLGRRR
jgi:hypothetical protein